MSWVLKSVAATLICLTAASCAWADLAEGIAAHEQGRFAAALREFRTAAEKGNPIAQFRLGLMYTRGQEVPKDARQAVFWYRKAAEQGNADAQVNLGVMYARLFGQGVPNDDQQAVFWYRKAAEQGNANAQFELAMMYESGRGLPKDEQQSVLWYRKAAEQGQAFAQVSLGMMYELGQGVAQDDGQAVVWYRKSAEQGNPLGQVQLGTMYVRGAGVPKDDQEAASWYLKAAEQGDVDAQLGLGRLYAKLGVHKDDGEASRWFLKAAEQGNAEAQVFLGFQFANGTGVPKDPQQAMLWYRKAADQGHTFAQKILGNAYARGQEVPKEAQQAYFWMLLSTSRGGSDGEVRIRDAVGAELSPQQRAEVQAAARDWKPQVPATVKPSAPARSGPESPSSTGSGFYVAGALVVTNHHVTTGCSRLRVNGHSEGRLLSSDSRNDLALISLQTESHDVATIRSGRVNVGEAATVVGFPLNGLLSGFNVTTGNVSSLAGIGGDTRLVQITAPVQPGNSGGPLLDAGGRVIGVVVSKLNALKVAQSTGDVPQNVNFAINANVLASFLDAKGVEYKSGASGSTISTQETARRAQAFTVLVECWK